MAWYRAGGGGIPAALKTGMNSVLNKKFGTATTYDPAGWPDDVNLLGKLPEKTVSGAIANITDGADRVPVKELIFSASPIQASGTPSPTNPLPIYGHMEMNGAHCGKNLLNPSIAFDNSNYYSYDSATGITTVNASDSRAWTNITEIPIKAGTYCLNNPQGRVQYRLKSESYGTDHNITSSSGTITLSADDGIKIKFGLGTTYPFTASYQLEVGSSATSFAPYSAESKKWEFPPFGKNLLNPSELVNGSINSSGADVTSTTRVRSGYVKINGGQNYAVSIGGTVQIYEIHQYKADFTKAVNLISANAQSYVFTADNNTAYIRVLMRFSDNSTIAVSDIVNLQCEQSSTATSYEPYQSMFSGQVNALTGEVENKNKFLVLTSANASLITRTNANKYRVSQAGTGAKISGEDYTGVICNVCKPETGTTNDDRCFIRGDGIIQLNFKNSYNSVSEMLADVGDIQLCYEMEEPISIDMDSVYWQSKYADNNFYNDCGNTSVTYRQDIDLALGGN